MIGKEGGKEGGREGQGEGINTCCVQVCQK